MKYLKNKMEFKRVSLMTLEGIKTAEKYHQKEEWKMKEITPFSITFVKGQSNKH